jgi:hypothetical protein
LIEQHNVEQRLMDLDAAVVIDQTVAEHMPPIAVNTFHTTRRLGPICRLNWVGSIRPNRSLNGGCARISGTLLENANVTCFSVTRSRVFAPTLLSARDYVFLGR